MNNLNIETRNYTPHDLKDTGIYTRQLPEANMYPGVVDGNTDITRPLTDPYLEFRPENAMVISKEDFYPRVFEDSVGITRPPTALGSCNYYYNMENLQREAAFYNRTLKELKEKDYTGMLFREDRQPNAVTYCELPNSTDEYLDAKDYNKANMNGPPIASNIQARRKNFAVPEENVYHRYQIPTEKVPFEDNVDITGPPINLGSANYYYNMKNLQTEAKYYTRTVMDLEEKGYRRKNDVIDCGRPNSIDPGFANFLAEYLHPNNLDIIGPPTAQIAHRYNINNSQGETACTTAFIKFGMRLMEEEHRRMNYGLPDSPDSEPFYSRTVTSLYGRVNVNISGTPAPNTEKSDSEIIDVCGLAASSTEAANIEELEIDYIDVCGLSTSLTKSELPGYDSMMSQERAESSQHYSSSECSHDGSEVRFPFSPDQKITSTPQTPQQRIIMLEPYVFTPTTSHKRIRRRYLNFRDPNMIYELSDISDDENDSDEPPAKRPDRDAGITHNEPIAEWVNDIVELYRLRNVNCVSVQF